MDQFSDTPLSTYDAEVIATVAHWGETPQKSGGFSLAACSYGVVITVNGEIVRQLWGAGYASNPIPTIALAVARTLASVTCAHPIIVRALEEFERYWGAGGIVAKAAKCSGRTSTGRKLAAWETMQHLQAQHTAGVWKPQAWPNMWGAAAFPVANGIAKGIGKQKALSHKAAFNPTSADHPDAVILQGGAHDLP